MEALQLILQFILELSNGKKGIYFLLLWITIIILLYTVIIFLAKIISVIEGFNRNRVNMKEVAIKNRIYHQFANISAKALENKDYSTAIVAMERCCDAIFGNGDGKINEPINISGQPTCESVSEQSGQGSSGLPDGSEESSVKITD